MKFDDRRIELRAAAVYQITYECYRQGAKVGEGFARTVNVSENGALVEMPQGIELDASLVLAILSPFYTLVIRGDVMHSRQISDHAYHVGVRLTDAIDGNWDHLKLDVRKCLRETMYEG